MEAPSLGDLLESLPLCCGIGSAAYLEAVAAVLTFCVREAHQQDRWYSRQTHLVSILGHFAYLREVLFGAASLRPHERCPARVGSRARRVPMVLCRLV